MRIKAIATLTSVLAAAANAAEYKIEVTADRASAVYKVGMTAKFTVKVTAGDGAAATNGAVDCVTDNFGSKVLSSNRVDLAAGNPFTVEGALKRPGFLRLQVRAAAPGDKIANKTQYAGSYIWSVAFDPEKIVQPKKCPDDFDAFWADGAAKLAREVPLDPQMEKDAARSGQDKSFDWYHVSFATFGGRVYGWLSLPKRRAAGVRMPGRVSVPGAGFGSWSQNGSSSAGAASLTMTVFPFPPDTDLEKNRPAYTAMDGCLQKKWGVGGYSRAGITGGPEDGYYYPVLLGINRAVDWFADREYIDRKALTYSGTSQGGGFGLFLMGLNTNFTHGCVFVPALTGHYAHLYGGQDGWPQFMDSVPAEGRAAVERNAAYYDGVYFAERVRCPIRFAVGFSDPVCAPHAVYSAYNACGSGDKGIVHGLGMGHGVYGSVYGELGAWESAAPPPALKRVSIRSSADGSEQPAWFWAPGGSAKRPLLVELHSWSFGIVRDGKPNSSLFGRCREAGWAVICPNFRGPNNTPAACGSPLAVQDVVDAVAYAKAHAAIDDDRVYLIGSSGGGMMTLLTAGRHPEIWAGCYAACPISDLARWHAESASAGGWRDNYARMMEKSCGGTPAEKPDEYAVRSPLTHLAAARRAGTPVDICEGIHDGHSGSVPVGHSIRAFNILADEGSRISDADLDFFERNEKTPPSLAGEWKDPFFGPKIRIHFRRASANVRLTLFEGGHAGNYGAAFEWLSRQRRGRRADWSVPSAGRGSADASAR
ncbi:MAG: alpha/beta fold hydrolase [Kiritimatiellae bacterium]|nr:alpha/beta fold hydrolase [Kiritimatiellia bacterium]